MRPGRRAVAVDRTGGSEQRRASRAARRVAVELDYGDDRMSMRVADDGCGFDPRSSLKAPGHYGLVSMRERAEQVRGRITIASTPGNGTEIETVVPA